MQYYNIEMDNSANEQSSEKAATGATTSDTQLLSQNCFAAHFFSGMLEVNQARDKRILAVDNFHLSCDSDLFDPNENYIGTLIYSINGRNDFICRNGRHIKSGYVYIKNVKSLENIGCQTMHENALRSLIGEEFD